tara:strand:+ start:221 stop:370 length:150 start_codon:yes stop_codon:yes gene_type:complete
VKKIFPLVVALFLSTSPAFSWGWEGDGDCPFSKDKDNQEKTEQVEKSDK